MLGPFQSYQRDAKKGMYHSELAYRVSHPITSTILKIAAPETTNTPDKAIETIFDLYSIVMKKWPASTEQSEYFLDAVAGHLMRIYGPAYNARWPYLSSRYRFPPPASATAILTGRRRGKTTIVAIQIAICLIAMPGFNCLSFFSSNALAVETHRIVMSVLSYITEELQRESERTNRPPRYEFDVVTRNSPHPEIKVTGLGDSCKENKAIFLPSLTKDGTVRLDFFTLLLPLFCHSHTHTRAPFYTTKHVRSAALFFFFSFDNNSRGVGGRLFQKKNTCTL
jgi:hypothetical protein